LFGLDFLLQLSALSHRDKTKVSLLICLAFFKLRRVRIDL
jgi:hypothetical protein